MFKHKLPDNYKGKSKTKTVLPSVIKNCNRGENFFSLNLLKDAWKVFVRDLRPCDSTDTSSSERYKNLRLSIQSSATTTTGNYIVYVIVVTYGLITHSWFKNRVEHPISCSFYTKDLLDTLHDKSSVLVHFSSVLLLLRFKMNVIHTTRFIIDFATWLDRFSASK